MTNNLPQIKKRMNQHFLLVTLCFFSVNLTSIVAEPLQEKVQQAIEIYAEAQSSTDREERMEKFRQAQRLFSYVSDKGVNTPALYTNIGTSALQAENLGNAVLSFRRALLLDPDYPKALKNLKQARKLLPNWVPKPSDENILDSFFTWNKSISTSERTGLAAIFFFVSSIGFSISIYWRIGAVRNLSFLPLFIWIVLITSHVIEINSSDGKEAVVTVNDTIARVSDSINSPQSFSQPLPAGIEVVVLEERGDWARVILSNRREAWLSIRSLTFLSKS